MRRDFYRERDLISSRDQSTTSTMHLDPTTQSNYWEVATENVAFDWDVDFNSKTISGSASYTLRVKTDAPKEVMYVSDMSFLRPW